MSAIAVLAVILPAPNALIVQQNAPNACLMQTHPCFKAILALKLARIYFMRMLFKVSVYPAKALARLVVLKIFASAAPKMLLRRFIIWMGLA
jgi:hypothetical protein